MGNEQTLYNVLKYGGYQSINENDENEYNAYHPEYCSDGWINAMIMAEVVYKLLGENIATDTSENQIRTAIENHENIYGDKMTNTIGECDSFWGDGNANHFYEM